MSWGNVENDINSECTLPPCDYVKKNDGDQLDALHKQHRNNVSYFLLSVTIILIFVFVFTMIFVRDPTPIENITSGEIVAQLTDKYVTNPKRY